ncbi:MAG: hypothetical protein MUE88_00935 [Flavobacteriales bacterium]|nr:hypothetical protein [Flavobacteriales bacterium]
MQHMGWVAVAAMVLASCGKGPAEGPAQAGVLRLVVVPEWQGEPLQFFTEYREHMDRRVTVELLKMYFGELQLEGAGEPQALNDVVYMDLSDGPVAFHWAVDAGSHTAITGHLGVPEAMNYADPSLYGAGHPLNVNNGTYWTWATGYRFAMFEGRYDLDPASTAPLVNAFVFHPGREFCYLPLTFAPSGGVTVEPGDTTEVRVVVDVEKFFHSSAGQIDLATENQDHGGVPALALKMATNIQLSMSVE